MAANGRNGNGTARTSNGNGRNGNGGTRKPVAVVAVTPSKPATAVDHAMAARQHSDLASYHAGKAARLAKQPRSPR